MIKIAVDMMGGDLGIFENKKAIRALLGENTNIEFYLVGDESKLSLLVTLNVKLFTQINT